MLKIIKKIASAVTAAMMLSAMASAVPAGAAETDVIFDDECENLELDGLDVWTSIYDKQLPGYSGLRLRLRRTACTRSIRDMFRYLTRVRECRLFQ